MKFKISRCCIVIVLTLLIVFSSLSTLVFAAWDGSRATSGGGHFVTGNYNLLVTNTDNVADIFCFVLNKF